MPTASGASEAPRISDVIGGLDGLIYKGACSNETSAAYECVPVGCQGGQLDATTEFNVGGNAGEQYDVGLHVYGVVELHKAYLGGTRRQGAASNAQSKHDFWYPGGSFENGYNVYALRVTPAVPGVANPEQDGNNYFLNARDSSNEGHEVWELNYDAQIRVQSGGKVTFRAFDPNCLQIQNVGSAARPAMGTGPGGALIVSGVEQAMPAPQGLTQPLTTNGKNGQWVYVDVTSISLVN
jgi:hypothetical protein